MGIPIRMQFAASGLSGWGRSSQFGSFSLINIMGFDLAKCTLFDTGHFPGFHIHRDTSPGALGPTRFHRSKGRRSGTGKGWRTANICQISGWRCRSWWRQLESKHSGQLPGAGLISRAIQSTDISCKRTLAGICCPQTDKAKGRRFISDV